MSQILVSMSLYLFIAVVNSSNTATDISGHSKQAQESQVNVIPSYKLKHYPSRAIDATFRTINWNQRPKMLEPKKRVADDALFAQYRGCVFSNRNAPGSAELGMELDLSLEELREQGQGRDIFPPRAFFAVRSALPMGYILPR